MSGSDPSSIEPFGRGFGVVPVPTGPVGLQTVRIYFVADLSKERK